MSDEAPELKVTLSTGDWWTYAGILQVEWPKHSSLYARVTAFRAHGCTIAAADSRAEITSDDKKTTIAVTTTPAFADAWRTLLTKIEQISTAAYMARRAAVGLDFKRVLDRYYAARARGEKPKLKDMAAAADLSYGALRQYKIDYDAERETDS